MIYKAYVRSIKDQRYSIKVVYKKKVRHSEHYLNVNEISIKIYMNDIFNMICFKLFFYEN
jgi:hypothetical protein